MASCHLAEGEIRLVILSVRPCVSQASVSLLSDKRSWGSMLERKEFIRHNYVIDLEVLLA